VNFENGFYGKAATDKNNLLFPENNLLFLSLSKSNLLILKNNMLLSLNKFETCFLNTRSVRFVIDFNFLSFEFRSKDLFETFLEKTSSCEKV